jgi:hypothetical protein
VALLYRKQIRDAALRFLSNGTNGFNAIFQAVSGTFNVPFFEIDWSPQSDNFALCFVEPDHIESSNILEFPGALMYTTEAEDTGEPRGVPFFGAVILAIDFYVRLREGAEQSTEDLMDAVEASVMAVLNNPANQWPPGVLFTRKTKIARMPIQPLADGFQQLIRIEAQFGSASTTF